MARLRIIFLGTPEFAVSSLEALHAAGYEIAAVVTAPDTPSGRGLKLQSSPVKICASRHGIPVLQPGKLKDAHFLSELESFRAELMVIVAFRMLPSEVWAMPALGTFNLHASLLPQYRGAAPINRAIMNGETETGVTTFFLKHEIDTGNVIFRETVAIGPDETAGELHDRLMEIGARLVVKTAKSIEAGHVILTNQDDLVPPGTILKPAPKIFREECVLDWRQPVGHLFNKVRGLSPYPGAFTFLRSPAGVQTQVKLYRSKMETMVTPAGPGAVISDGKHFLKIAAADGWLEILEIQQAGKRRMGIREFLMGFNVGASFMAI